MTTNYYLAESRRGNAAAAFEASKVMALEGWSDYFVQQQIYRSAENGHAPAQRWLGILGLFKRLITKESTVSSISFYETYDVAMEWLNEAACTGDLVATYIIAKCCQHGVGIEKDEERALEIFNQVAGKMNEETVLAIMFAFESILQMPCTSKEITEMNKFDKNGITAKAS